MMRIILHFTDKQNFGNQIIVYTGSGRDGELFFVIIADRDEIAYYFVDKNLEKMYPANSYIASLRFEYNIHKAQTNLDIEFDIDLSRYGSSKCPAFLSELILQHI